MSNKPTDTATVKATYSTAATFMQSPSPTRMEKFDKWLNEVKAQAWDESATEACGGNWLPGTNGNPGRPNLPDMKRRNPYRKGN